MHQLLCKAIPSQQMVVDGTSVLNFAGDIWTNSSAVDVYLMSPSIWDAAMFMFTECISPVDSILMMLLWMLNLTIQCFFVFQVSFAIVF